VLRRRVALSSIGCALASALVLPSLAAAGIFYERASPTTVRPGEIVRVRIYSGLAFPDSFPLYLVSTSKAKKNYRCAPNSICSPVVSYPPSPNAYMRVGSLDFRRSQNLTVAVRVPQVAPGKYEFAIYFGAAIIGARHTLINSTPKIVLTVN
jgi:hypothetical protein